MVLIDPLWIPKQLWGRWILLALAIGQNALLGGAVFGFNAIVPSLRAVGAFADLCGAGSPPEVECPERSASFSNMYLAGSITFLFAPAFFGPLMDRVGPAWIARVGVLILLCGLLSFSAALFWEINALLYVGMALLGFAGLTPLFTVVSVSTLFPGRKGTVIAAVNGSVDLGSLVFLLIAGIVNAGLRPATAFLVYACFPGAIFVFAAFFIWPHRPYDASDLGELLDVVKPDVPRIRSSQGFNVSKFIDVGLEEKKSRHDVKSDLENVHEEDENEEEDEDDMTDTGSPTRNSQFSPKGAVGADANTPMRAPAMMLSEHASTRQPSQKVFVGPREGMPTSIAGAKATVEPTVQSAMSMQPKWGSNTVWEQLQTWDFRFTAIFFATCIFKFNFYLSTIRQQLINITGTEVKADGFLEILSIILPIGCLFVFVSGEILDRFGVHIGFFFLITAALVHSLLMFIPNGEAQIATFIVFTVFRATLFSTQSAFVAERFGFRTFGTILAAFNVIGAIVTMLQFPIIEAIFAFQGGIFLIPNIIITVLIACLYLFAVWFLLEKTREQQTVKPA